MADVEMQDASSAKDKAVKTSKNAAGEGSEGKKRFEVKKVSITFPTDFRTRLSNEKEH
jgi:hypothetical protein